MIQFSHKTSVTLALSPSADPDFYALPPMIAQVLAQAGATVSNLDLGLRGDSAEYTSDHGHIEITGRLREDGIRQVTITCNTLSRGTREIGRQLAFQIARRLRTRLPITSIFWQPTRQRLRPAEFTWSALEDAPQRWGAPSASIVPTHYACATA